MGYRSEVCIKCEPKAYELFKKAWKEVDFAPDKVMRDSNDEYYIQWDWVKWYEDYEDVKAIENVMSELDEYQSPEKENEENEIDGYRYKMIRLGEDDGDVESRDNSWEIEFYYVRKFDIPDDCDEVKIR